MASTPFGSTIIPGLADASGAADWESAVCLGGMSKLHVSVVVSLEIARLLIGATRPADAELAEAARRHCSRAWDTFRRAGRVVAGYAQTAQWVAHRVVPDLEEVVKDADKSAAATLFSQVKGVVGEMEKDSEILRRSYADLGDEVRDLIWRLQLFAAAGETPAADVSDVALAVPGANAAVPAPLSQGWAARRSQDIQLLAARAAERAAERGAPLALLGEGADGEDAPELLEMLLASEKGTSPSAVELCSWLSARDAGCASADAATLYLPDVLRELEHADANLRTWEVFWDGMTHKVHRLSLAQDHAERLASHASGSALLRERCRERLTEYSAHWGSIESCVPLYGAAAPAPFAPLPRLHTVVE